MVLSACREERSLFFQWCSFLKDKAECIVINAELGLVFQRHKGSNCFGSAFKNLQKGLLDMGGGGQALLNQ